MVFHWSLRDSKSPQVSRSLLSILAVLNNAVVWIESTRPPTSKSSSSFRNPLVTVPNAPIKIIVTCMFHSFFNSLARSRYLSFFSHSFSFILWSAGTAKSTILHVLFFFCWLLLSLVFWPWLGDPCVCQSPIGVYVCHFLGQVLGCTYTICWHGQIYISCTSPSGSLCRPNHVYSFGANLLHSLMWLMVSSLSLHSLHLLFCCVISIFALIWLVLTSLSCAAIRRDSVSLLKFPFLSHVRVLSCEMFISRLNHPYSSFPSHFYFLVIVILLSIVLSVSFLKAVMSAPSCFCI